eukprot:8329570-Pyramimonas_sp.AAC.1
MVRSCFVEGSTKPIELPLGSPVCECLAHNGTGKGQGESHEFFTGCPAGTLLQLINPDATAARTPTHACVLSAG